MYTEVIALGLKQVGGKVLGPVAVIERQGGGEGRRRDTELNTLGNSTPPSGLGVVDGGLKEVVEQQVLEVRLGTVGLGDVGKEDRADDASTAPHEGDSGVVELPVVLLSSLLDVAALVTTHFNCRPGPPHTWGAFGGLAGQ